MINTVKVECDLQTLMNVLNATGNPAVAIQMLEGVYERPSIADEKIGRWDTKKETIVKINEYGQEETVETEEKVPVIYTLESYCPFSNKVTFTKNDGWKRTDDCTLEWWNALENPYQFAV